MNNILRKIFITVIILMMTVLLTASASASDIPFDDVPSYHPYYREIKYLSEHELIYGISDNYYSPNEYITARQWAVIICRILNVDIDENNSTDKFGIKCLEYCFNNRYLSHDYIWGYDEPMYRGAIYLSAFKLFDIPVYDNLLYPDCNDVSGELVSGEWRNALRVAHELGLTDSEHVIDHITRGEAAKILYDLLTKRLILKKPPILDEIDIKYNDDRIRLNYYLVELNQLPKNIIDEFNNNHWEYVIDSEYLDKYNKELNRESIAITHRTQRRIYIIDPYSTIHEFGHFLDNQLGFPTKHDYLYQVEGKNTTILGRYATKNSREFFAEAFDYWINFSNIDEEMIVFKNELPETYEYFKQLESQGWC